MEQAQVAKLVDAPVSGTGDASHGGSSPLLGTKTHEALIITAEECAEVIQQISKIIRFGIDLPYVTAGDGTTNRQQLEKEVGDLICMIDILIELGIIDSRALTEAEIAKREKLKRWSNLFK
jgi:NTP pyrophosphatase (non-canonical NTP hydrolase)